MPIEYISVKEYANRNGLSERTVRNYCAVGRIEGAILVGKTWSIPADAVVMAKKRACTSDSRKSWFMVGDYKKLPNEVGGIETTSPEDVHRQIKSLLKEYNSVKQHTLDDILDFHQRFEVIHPFQDGNGRVGRLIMFKECLRNNIVPFIITDQLRDFYYRGLQQWTHIPCCLRDTCLAAQDDYKQLLDYFKIKYK